MSNLATEAAPVGSGWIWSIFALAGIILLLFPSVGPLLDHHFAEREPNHQHVYLGKAVPDHIHPYQARHNHSHGNEQSELAYNESDLASLAPGDGIGDVVYLTSQDGMGFSTSSVTNPAAPSEIIFPHPGDYCSLSVLIRDHDIPIGAFIPPPDRPPRV